MVLDEWARRWNISGAALADLRVAIGIGDQRHAAEGLSEAGVQSRIRLEATVKKCRLWRNNIGATITPDGSFVRYGLANDSAAINSRIKSADLIGIRPVTITGAHVGMIIGQFLSREVKASRWRYTGTAREQAQLRWAELILALGGDAGFATGEGSL